MTFSITWAVTRRVLTQLRRDPRTMAMLLAVPCLLLALLKWMFHRSDAMFDFVGPPLLAMFPFIVMFLVASVTTLRERASGTLERLLSMPMGKLDLILGYALAFAAVALVQALVAVSLTVGWLGLQIAGSVVTLTVVAVLDAVVGTTLGLFVSAFAQTEFQAVQFMPAVVIPQILLCGLFVPRADLPGFLSGVSDVLPLSYAVDAMQRLQTSPGMSAGLVQDIAVVSGFIVAGIALGAATLRRRTP